MCVWLLLSENLMNDCFKRIKEHMKRNQKVSHMTVSVHLLKFSALSHVVKIWCHTKFSICIVLQDSFPCIIPDLDVHTSLFFADVFD